MSCFLFEGPKCFFPLCVADFSFDNFSSHRYIFIVHFGYFLCELILLPLDCRCTLRVFQFPCRCTLRIVNLFISVLAVSFTL